MKIGLNITNKPYMELLESYSLFREAVSRVAYSSDNKMVVGNYGEWEIRYKHDDVEGFVTANGIIDMNGKRIAIKPGFIVDTEEKDTETLFANITNMLTIMTENINNTKVLNREHNMYKIDIKKTIEAAKRALKKITKKQDEEMNKRFGF